MIQNDVLVMITIYTNFWGAISSTQISNFLLIFLKGELYEIFFYGNPLEAAQSQFFNQSKKNLNENMFFYQMSLPLPASSQNSTKMKNHSSLIHIDKQTDPQKGKDSIKQHNKNLKYLTRLVCSIFYCTVRNLSTY